jgi:anti-sigma factor RsiW
MTMWHREHIVKWLSAYAHGEVPAGTARRVASHLAECPGCRRRFDAIARGARLAARLPLQPAPPALDDSFREAIAGGQRAAPLRFYRSAARPRWRLAIAVGTAVAAALLVTLWVFTPRPAAVDLASYLDRVQARETTRDAIGGSPFAFREIPATVALDAAGVGSTGEPPLEGYVLHAARVSTVTRQRVVQLVYAREGDLFTVFVAPRQVPFALGARDTEPARIDNIQCRRVDCPRTTTVLFGDGAFHCVLVSRVRDDRSTGDIMRYFVRAHAGPKS